MVGRDLMFVEDFPESTEVRTLSLDPREVRLYRKHHRAYCATVLDGCGEQLIIAAGDERIPYLRHHPDSSCTLIGDTDRYTHLLIQTLIAQWMRALGASSVHLEHRVEGGRADVRCMLEGTAYSVEVQRSPITTTEVDRRTEVYRTDGATVVWLFTSMANRTPAPGDALLRLDPYSWTLAVQLRDSAGFSSHSVPLSACMLSRGRGVVHPFWTPAEQHRAFLQRRMEEDGLGVTYRQQYNAVRDLVLALRGKVLRNGYKSWQFLEQAERHTREEQRRRRAALQAGRPHRVPSAPSPNYFLVRQEALRPMSLELLRPVNSGGYPVCLVCGVLVLADYVVHPDNHMPCAKEWLRRHPSILFQDNAPDVADKVRGFHGVPYG